MPFLKAHDHAATIPDLVFGDLFLMMVFHRRSKRVKMFSETFVTMYLYKRDSNTSERTCVLIHNYLKEKLARKKVF